MEVARIKVTGAEATEISRRPITAGMIGARIHIEYADTMWDGLRKTVVFCGVKKKDVVTDEADVTIPKECIAKPITSLLVGVFGADSEKNLAIPTIWANIGPVLNAANPSGDTSTDPSLPVWAQILDMIGTLDELPTEAKNNLVAAIAEVSGSVADVRLDVSDEYIRYSADGGESWKNLIAVADLVGPQGDPGADATVTYESIHAALGYTPADEQEVAKTPEFSGAPSVGQIFKVSAVGEDGKVTMKPVDMPSAAGINAIKANDTTFSADDAGVIAIPVAGEESARVLAPSLVRVSNLNYGIGTKRLDGYDVLCVRSASDWCIVNGRGEYAPLFMGQFDKTLRYAMCDGKSPAWTDVERLAALLRMGCTVDENGCVKWAAQEVAE